MKIYIFTFKNFIKLFKAFFIILCIFTAFTFVLFKLDRSVFNSNKELPIYYVDTLDKKVSITFDCAWGADDIPTILDTLKTENVKVSFFFVGQWAEKFPDVVKMISNDGHDIANHSYSHLRMGTLGKSKISSEITLCGKTLSDISGKKINLFRPPYGDYNNDVIRTARSLGYYPIQWNIDSLDWKPNISKDEILNRVTKNLKNGSIILFHNDTTHTANLLPGIIKGIKNQGYSIVPVSELIYKDEYKILHDGKQILE